MTRQNIATGTTPNDGTGDSLRAAANKINDNFSELYTKLGGDVDNLSASLALVNGEIVFTGTGNTTSFDFTDPTANRTITVPDASGDLVTTSATQILTNKSFRSPQINDTNGNEIIKFNTVGSAINEFTFANASSLNNPSISATGGSANIGLTLSPKGTGTVNLNKVSLASVTQTANGAASTTSSYIICNKGSALAISMADGTVVGETKTFTNKGVGVATVTPTSFAGGTSFAMTQNTGTQCIWDGTNWFLVGAVSGITVT